MGEMECDDWTEEEQKTILDKLHGSQWKSTHTIIGNNEHMPIIYIDNGIVMLHSTTKGKAAFSSTAGMSEEELAEAHKRDLETWDQQKDLKHKYGRLGMDKGYLTLTIIDTKYKERFSEHEEDHKVFGYEYDEQGWPILEFDMPPGWDKAKSKDEESKWVWRRVPDDKYNRHVAPLAVPTSSAADITIPNVGSVAGLSEEEHKEMPIQPKVVASVTE